MFIYLLTFTGKYPLFSINNYSNKIDMHENYKLIIKYSREIKYIH